MEGGTELWKEKGVMKGGQKARAAYNPCIWRKWSNGYGDRWDADKLIKILARRDDGEDI